jgi:GNAT superfamily N-acetyltransferase
MQAREIHCNGRSVIVRGCTALELVPLRHRMLRQGLPVKEAHFPGDDLPTTRHAGAFVDNNAVCCATLLLHPWENETAWRLRGMATDLSMQKTGVGKAVLQFLTDWVLTEPPPEALINSKPTRLFWCNARTPALEFYKKQGWTIVSEEFDIPTAGPHHNMVRRI